MDIYAYVIGGLGALVLAIAPLAWGQMDARVTRTQDSVRELFNVFREHETADRDRHDELVRTINSNHVQILEKL